MAQSRAAGRTHEFLVAEGAEDVFVEIGEQEGEGDGEGEVPERWVVSGGDREEEGRGRTEDQARVGDVEEAASGCVELHGFGFLIEGRG